MSDLLTPLAWSASERDVLPEFSRSATGRKVAAADAAEAIAADKAQPAMFAWPTPPFASYPQAVEQQPSEPCVIVGLNDKVIFAPDLLDDGGDHREAALLGGPPAPLPRDDLVTVTRGSHQDRLQHADLAN